MKIPKAILVWNEDERNRELYSVKRNKSLYILKQSERMSYIHLSDFLSKKGYTNSEHCPCVFIYDSRMDYV